MAKITDVLVTETQNQSAELFDQIVENSQCFFTFCKIAERLISENCGFAFLKWFYDTIFMRFLSKEV